MVLEEQVVTGDGGEQVDARRVAEVDRLDDVPRRVGEERGGGTARAVDGDFQQESLQVPDGGDLDWGDLRRCGSLEGLHREVERGTRAVLRRYRERNGGSGGSLSHAGSFQRKSGGGGRRGEVSETEGIGRTHV